MVIRKGEDWGWAASVPATAAHCEDDVSLAAAAAAAYRQGDVLEATLSRGDLWRTVGGIDGQPASGESRCLPIDLGVVSLDGAADRYFVAHVIVRRVAWQGEGLAAMNAAWLGDLYLGPRAHPNDNLLDITIGRIPWRQRLEARKRAKSGMHLPHPELAVKRVPTLTHTFSRPTMVRIDGQKTAPATQVEVRLIPDAIRIYV